MLYSRITGQSADVPLNWNALSSDQMRVALNMYKVFKKQNPAVLLHYKLNGGVTKVSESTGSSSVLMTKTSMVNEIIKSIVANNNDLFTKTKTGFMVKKALTAITFKNNNDRYDFLGSLGIEFTPEEIAFIENNKTFW